MNVASGIYWEPQYSNSPVKACEFGTVGDGTFNQSTNAITGTDNITQIQAALDYAMQNRFASVCLNDGQYKTTDTIQLGWGETFRTLSLVNCNQGRNDYNGLEGVRILPTKTDRCAINIQGQRSPRIKGIEITGQNWVFGNAIPVPYPTTAAGWLDPALAPTGSNPGGLTQYTPYAAICIDAFSGAQAPANGRTTSYPTVTYPSWTGVGTTQYNKNFSSDVVIEDVQIDGFAVAVVVQPNAVSGNGDGNGDFLKTYRLQCNFGIFCVSVGNTQSRSVRVDDIHFKAVYAAITNNANGTLQGYIGGPLSNWSGEISYQWAQIGTLADGDPIEFVNGYSETVVQFGTFGAGQNFNNSVRFDGITFLQSENIEGQIPPCLVVSSGTPISFTFNDVSLFGGNRINNLTCGNASVYVNGGMWEGAHDIGNGLLLTDAGLFPAVSYTGSTFVGSANSIPTLTLQSLLTWGNATNAIFEDASGNKSAQKLGKLVNYNAEGGAVRGQYTQSSLGFVDGQNSGNWKFSMGPTGGNISLTAPDVTAGPTYTSCDVMQFTYLAANQVTQSLGLAVGDILYLNNTGTIYVVTAVGAPGPNYVITTRQMNNMTINTSTGACVANTEASFSGALAIITHTGRVKVPQTLYWCDFVKGSTAGTNCHRGDGFGGNLDTFIKNGDMFWGFASQDVGFSWTYPVNTILSGVTNGSPGSLTLSAAALTSGRYPLVPLPTAGLQGKPATSQVLNLTNGTVTQAQATTAFIGPAISSATEALVEVPCPASGMFTKLSVFATAPASGQTLTSTLRVNGSDTALTCAITGTATACNDTAHQAACAANQLYSVKNVTSATSGTMNTINAGVEFVHP